MGEEVVSKENKEKDNIRISYYFTVLFMAIGSILVFYILYQKMEKLNLFMVLLSMSAGGLPIGVIGAFIDFKVSEYRVGSIKK